MSDIQRIRNLTDDSSLGSFKNEVIMMCFKKSQDIMILILGIGE